MKRFEDGSADVEGVRRRKRNWDGEGKARRGKRVVNLDDDEDCYDGDGIVSNDAPFADSKRKKYKSSELQAVAAAAAADPHAPRAKRARKRPAYLKD